MMQLMKCLPHMMLDNSTSLSAPQEFLCLVDEGKFALASGSAANGADGGGAILTGVQW